MTTWNFLPFLLQRVGETPAWVVNLLYVVWSAALAGLAATLWRLSQWVARLNQA